MTKSFFLVIGESGSDAPLKDDDDRDDRRGGFLRLERGRRQPPPEHRLHHLRRDQGWKDVGYHGSYIKTTNIDTLAQGGADAWRLWRVKKPARWSRSPILGSTVPLGVVLRPQWRRLSVWAVVYGFGWTPSPVAATLIAMLFVIPYAIVVRLNTFRDIEGLAAMQFTVHGKRVASKTAHVWASYVIPDLILQMIINLPLANQGFSQAAAMIAEEAGSGMVPAQALVADFAITFMFVCCFTFLAVILHTTADMYEGEFSNAGHARGMNGFLYFGLLLLMGVGLGVLVAGVTQALAIQVVSFPVAMALKFLVVCLSVGVAWWLGVGWEGKKFNDAVKMKMAAVGGSAPAKRSERPLLSTRKIPVLALPGPGSASMVPPQLNAASGRLDRFAKPSANDRYLRAP